MYHLHFRCQSSLGALLGMKGWLSATSIRDIEGPDEGYCKRLNRVARGTAWGGATHLLISRHVLDACQPQEAHETPKRADYCPLTVTPLDLYCNIIVNSSLGCIFSEENKKHNSKEAYRGGPFLR